MIPEKEKVWLYILRRRDEIELLVFEHVGVDAGIQIPAGTVESKESFQAAAERELHEEAGVMITTLAPFGEYRGEWDGQAVCAHWYWAWASEDLPNAWTHRVTGSGEDNGMQFHYYWLPRAEWEKLFGDFKRAYPALEQWSAPEI